MNEIEEGKQQKERNKRGGRSTARKMGKGLGYSLKRGPGNRGKKKGKPEHDREGKGSHNPKGKSKGQEARMGNENERPVEKDSVLSKKGGGKRNKKTGQT